MSWAEIMKAVNSDIEYPLNNDLEFFEDIEMKGFTTLVPGTYRPFARSSVTLTTMFQNCKNLSLVSMPNCTNVETNAFDGCTALTDVYLPNAEGGALGTLTSLTDLTYGASIVPAFSTAAPNLVNANFPRATSMVNTAFVSHEKISSITCPELLTIGQAAFMNTKLVSVSFPKLQTIYQSAFTSCSLLRSISFPNLTTMSQSTFQDCYSLEEVNLPNFVGDVAAGGRAFMNCSSLTSVYLPKAVNIGQSMFYNCKNITYAYFKSLSSLPSGIFYNNGPRSVMLSLYLMSTSVVTMTYYFSSYFGNYDANVHIYVPSSLVAAYKSASRWSYVASLIFSA